MTTVHNTNKACCSIPAVQVDYTAEGTYKPYGAFDRVYVTGDKSETALVVVYDIFGYVSTLWNAYRTPTRQSSYFSQTLQGADILAKTLGAQVFMPDFFGEGKAFGIEKLPPRNEQDKKDLQEFFGSIANPPATAAKLVDFANVLKGEGFKNVGAHGYCWGSV